MSSEGTDDNNLKPREYRLKDDMLQIAATMVFMGYWFGQGFGFLKAGLSSDPSEVIQSGVAQRDAAIGVMVAGSVGMLYVLGRLAVCRVWPEWEACIKNDIPQVGSLERQRVAYRLSTSAFYSWDMRLFLASQAVAALTAVGMANSGSDAQRQFGDPIGRGIGTIVGCALGLLLPSMLVRYIAKHFLKDPVAEIAQQKWFNEGRHNVPSYARLFFGAWTGYVAISVLSTPKDAYGFLDIPELNHNRLIGTILFAGLAFLSPLIFSALRRIFKYTYDKLNPKNDEQTFRSPHFLFRSRMDLPWYVRLFCGVVAAATVGLVSAAYHQDDHINKSWIYLAGTFSLFSPFLLTMFEKFTERYTADILCAEQGMEPAPLKLAFDMPWYSRAAFSALAGAMLGDASVDAHANANNYSYSAAPSQVPLICTGVVLSLALVSPFFMAVIKRCGFTHEYMNPADDNHADLNWPWYTRLLAGLWLGALTGAAFAHFSPGADNAFIIPGFIGPEFLGINNEYGAPTTALVFGAIGILWPIAQMAWDKVESKGFLNTLSYFKHCCRRDTDAENDPLIQYVP